VWIADVTVVSGSAIFFVLVTVLVLVAVAFAVLTWTTVVVNAHEHCFLSAWAANRSLARTLEELVLLAAAVVVTVVGSVTVRVTSSSTLDVTFEVTVSPGTVVVICVVTLAVTVLAYTVVVLVLETVQTHAVEDVEVVCAFGAACTIAALASAEARSVVRIVSWCFWNITGVFSHKPKLSTSVLYRQSYQIKAHALGLTKARRGQALRASSLSERHQSAIQYTIRAILVASRGHLLFATRSSAENSRGRATGRLTGSPEVIFTRGARGGSCRCSYSEARHHGHGSETQGSLLFLALLPSA